MDDTIYRQAAVKHLKHRLYETAMNNDDLAGVFSEIADNRVETWINELPPAAPRWIPCSERLPHITDHHISKPCLVYCDNGAYTFAELEENIFGQVGWDCERDDDYHEAVGVVVAWMPLPDPWKGEEE